MAGKAIMGHAKRAATAVVLANVVWAAQNPYEARELEHWARGQDRQSTAIPLSALYAGLNPYEARELERWAFTSPPVAPLYTLKDVYRAPKYLGIKLGGRWSGSTLRQPPRQTVSSIAPKSEEFEVYESWRQAITAAPPQPTASKRSDVFAGLNPYEARELEHWAFGPPRQAIPIPLSAWHAGLNPYEAVEAQRLIPGAARQLEPFKLSSIQPGLNPEESLELHKTLQGAARALTALPQSSWYPLQIEEALIPLPEELLRPHVTVPRQPQPIPISLVREGINPEESVEIRRLLPDAPYAPTAVPLSAIQVSVTPEEARELERFTVGDLRQPEPSKLSAITAGLNPEEALEVQRLVTTPERQLEPEPFSLTIPPSIAIPEVFTLNLLAGSEFARPLYFAASQWKVRQIDDPLIVEVIENKFRLSAPRQPQPVKFSLVRKPQYKGRIFFGHWIKSQVRVPLLPKVSSLVPVRPVGLPIIDLPVELQHFLQPDPRTRVRDTQSLYWSGRAGHQHARWRFAHPEWQRLPFFPISRTWYYAPHEPAIDVERHWTIEHQRQFVRQTESAFRLLQISPAVDLPEELSLWTVGQDSQPPRQHVDRIITIKVTDPEFEIPIELRKLLTVVDRHPTRPEEVMIVSPSLAHEPPPGLAALDLDMLKERARGLREANLTIGPPLGLPLAEELQRAFTNVPSWPARSPESLILPKQVDYELLPRVLAMQAFVERTRHYRTESRWLLTPSGLVVPEETIQWHTGAERAAVPLDLEAQQIARTPLGLPTAEESARWWSTSPRLLYTLRPTQSLFLRPPIAELLIGAPLPFKICADGQIFTINAGDRVVIDADGQLFIIKPDEKGGQC